jgi:PAS domain S-box-containing protein
MSQLPFSTDVVLESLNDGFQAFDREWRYAYLNRRAEQILGQTREELLGKVCWEQYPEAVGTDFHARYVEAMESRRTVVFESFCPHEKKWAEFSLHPYPGGLGAFTRDITERKQAEEAVRESEQQYRALFDQVQSAVVLADNSGRYVEANPAACDLFGTPREALLGKSILDFSPPGTGAQVKDAWRDFLQTGEQNGDFVLHRPDGTQRMLEYRARANVRPGVHLSVLRDITDRRRAEERARLLLADLEEERDTLDAVNHIGRLLSAELNLERLVQAATDAATELTGAQFGAFFYNVTDPKGDSYTLYTISGVPREAFSRFPMPRATHLFGPTFRAEGIIRSGDVTRDPRYGQMAPYHGMPKGHLPVRSYLAVPVVSRSGEVLGGLFFGHADPDVFTERAERNLVALVAQVAVAVDNARLVAEKTALAERQADLLRQQRAFLKDVLFAVTDGTLILCDSEADLPPLPPDSAGPAIPLPNASTLRLLRREAHSVAETCGLPAERTSDLVTSVGEAAMNVVTHAAGKGEGFARVDPIRGVVQVWITDRGPGIPLARLHRAVLERGFTTAGTLGHGFWMMLQTADRVYLLTDEGRGTTVVIEKGRTPPTPQWAERQIPVELAPFA